jgi:hypothetical protein
VCKLTDLEVKFIEIPNVPKERGPIVSQLGGIYQFSIKNVGDKDAVSAWINGRVQLHGETGINIDEFFLQYPRISTGGGPGNPYFLKKLQPSSLYHMIAAISCGNCVETKQWQVDINTQDRSINLRSLPPGTGMWQKMEFW